jgi:integrase
MTKPKLTDARVRALEARSSDYVQWCGQLAGFGCRVRPSGSKSLMVQYDFGGRRGVTRRITLGRFPVLSVEDARREAVRILAKVKLGEDVGAERAARRSAITLAELCDEYFREGCGHKKASTISVDKGRVERHIKPLLGKRRIDQITKADVAKFLRDVANGQTATDVKTRKFGRAIVKGGKGTATRTLRLLGGIFSYAVERGYVEANPRAGVKGYEDKRNTRWLDNEELARLGETLRLAETEGLPWRQNEGVKLKHRAKAENAREPISPHAVAAIRLLLLTGCRLREILHLRWVDVSLERASIHLPDSKTGAKDLYLSAPALKVLSEIPRIKGNPYVIAGAKEGEPRSDLKRPWSRITEHAELVGLRLHDLRHSYASVGAASGMGLLFVGKLLGHASAATTERYAHIANHPLRQANEAIGQQIAEAMAGSAGDVGNVPHINRGHR